MITTETLVIGGALLVLAVALAGILSERHFIVIILGVDLVLVASTIILVTFLAYMPNLPSSSDAIAMLVAIWAVASVETITLIAFYVLMKDSGSGFDVFKFSRLKW